MQNLSDKSLEQLWKEVNHLSHADFPFLHPLYSPSSRIPCADFSPFIIQCLKQNNILSIQKLMRRIIAGNPGLGIGAEWIDKPVNDIIKMDFSRFFASKHSEAFWEVKALFILASKDGSGREFWLTDDKPILFASALCFNELNWLKDMSSLQEKANQFIQEMAKTIPYWEKYPLFEKAHFDAYPYNDTTVLESLLKLPLSARIHLLAFSKKGGGSLMQSTDYGMRSLGVNPLQTAPLLLNSGICVESKEIKLMSDVWSKSELVSILQGKNVKFKNSWKKEQLIEALAENAPNVIAEIAEKEKVAVVKPEFLNSLNELREYAKILAEPMKLLCFA